MSLISYLKDTRQELKHVTWPTRKQAIQYTIAVILISGITAYLLGFFDYIFSQAVQFLLNR